MGAVGTFDADGLTVGSHSDQSPHEHGQKKQRTDAAASEPMESQELELEVRWMATDNVVCLVMVSPGMSISQVKQLVQAEAGIPIEDQRLLLGGRELSGDAPLPSPLAAPLLLVRSVSDPRVSNLSHFRTETEFEALPQGAFTHVRKLASGIHGDIFQYRWHQQSSESTVAVKKLRADRLRRSSGTETDERVVHMEPWKKSPSAEDALTEIGVLTYLSRQADVCPYLLRMRGVFAEEGFAWLVTDFAEGGDLFDLAVSGRVREDKLQHYMFELLQAVEYLHRHRIGHRDISLENILLREDSVQLMDFGMSVCSHSASGVPLRFFRAVGKDSYRAPEVYCPTTAKTRVIVPAGSKPGSVAMATAGSGFFCEIKLPADAKPRQSCMAEVWGYAAQPADIFACGVSFFMLAWQCPPWRMATLADAMFSYVHNNGVGGVEALLRHWKRPLLSPGAMSFLAQTLKFDPAERPSAAMSLASPWLAPLGEAAMADVR
uniref:Protein kinase domain-containing protein n=1 Tax=Alexandrium catenella TaxID=2925 RepID=A0A7S1RJ38_ALECA|mmetsp:Transcript_60992/g.163286  ORF Transcript_60992/g.163286 Transcript_60992/m.163286 type:complete len:490 (+) Transcript_60992:71-1540(+)|eukprot:CAMPEP_0171174528 /NCGR_PEP_ID=MMETSP0790-20130122/10773_1 /TAXON_ID=2925 /ORGANISM="Alexandrium catenella, Strain OF101" /LENGTH=489 /DNA_ID=CAMNT_0011639403 /DNA_START=61 /DNA_END=1533 /DNA_ORIENTATION=+